MKNPVESITRALIKLRRKSLSNRIFADANGVVKRGVFAGLKLDGDSNVSRSCLGAKVLGIYEPAVFEAIEGSAPYDDAVCIGAADGYFGIGLVKSGLAKRSICFEMTELGRQAIAKNARDNGVADRVVILEKADETFGQKLKAAGFSGGRSLVICDIEGAEFPVLSREVLGAFDGALIIVELHDAIMKGAEGLRAALISRLPAGYSAKVVREKPVDWSGISELERLNDNDRALAASEGRKIIGEWLIARPAKA